MRTLLACALLCSAGGTALSQDEPRLVAPLRLPQTTLGQPRHALLADLAHWQRLQLSPDGRYLASSNLKYWFLRETGEPVDPPFEFPEEIHHWSFTRNSGILVTRSDGKIEYFQPGQRTAFRTWKAQAEYRLVDVSANGRIAIRVSRSAPQVLEWLDLGNPRSNWIPHCLPDLIQDFSVFLAPNGESVVFYRELESFITLLRIPEGDWQKQDLPIIDANESDRPKVLDVAFSPENAHLVALTTDNQLTRYNLKTGKWTFVRDLQTELKQRRSTESDSLVIRFILGFSAQSRSIICCLNYYVILDIPLDPKEPVRFMELNPNHGEPDRVLPGGVHLLQSMLDGLPTTVDLRTGKPVNQLGETFPFTSLQPIGKDRVICGNNRGRFIEWDLNTGRICREIRVNSQRLINEDYPTWMTFDHQRQLFSTQSVDWHFVPQLPGRFLPSPRPEGTLIDRTAKNRAIHLKPTSPDSPADWEVREARSNRLLAKCSGMSASWSGFRIHPNQRLALIEDHSSLKAFEFSSNSIRWTTEIDQYRFASWPSLSRAQFSSNGEWLYSPRGNVVARYSITNGGRQELCITPFEHYDSSAISSDCQWVAFSTQEKENPDRNLVAVGRWAAGHATHQQIFVTPRAGRILALAFTPDNRKLITTHTGGVCFCFDIADITQPTPEHRKLHSERIWSQLQSLDPASAAAGMTSLQEHPDAVGFLRGKLTGPAPAPLRPALIQRSIDQLSSRDFPTREEASRALLSCGVAVKPALEKARAQSASAEVHRRIDEILAQIDWKPGSRQAIASSRALEVLEVLGTPEAQQLLKHVSQTSSSPQLVEMAQDALDRIRKRPQPRAEIGRR